MTMLIKDNQLVPNHWHVLDGTEATLPDGQATLIPVARWDELRRSAIDHNAAIGIRIEPGDDVSEIATDLDQFDVIEIHFPTFKDGRGFSAARLLRERYDFRGELRASGHVIRDQFLFLHRCGFDAIELDERFEEEDWVKALQEYSVWYQPTGDGRVTVNEKRHLRAPALAAAE